MQENRFHITQLLTITGTTLLCQMSELEDILAFMIDRKYVLTNKLVIVADRCKPALLKRYPWLAEIETFPGVPPRVDPEKAVAKWLIPIIAKRGAYFTVPKI